MKLPASLIENAAAPLYSSGLLNLPNIFCVGLSWSGCEFYKVPRRKTQKKIPYLDSVVSCGLAVNPSFSYLYFAIGGMCRYPPSGSVDCR
jgi:hypothetical protein